MAGRMASVRLCVSLALSCLVLACAPRDPHPVQAFEAPIPPLPVLRDPPPEPIRGLFPGLVLVETQDLDQGDIALILDEETES